MCEPSCISRRHLLRASVAALACPLLAACSDGSPNEPVREPPAPDVGVTIVGDVVVVDIARVPAFAGTATGEVAVVFLGAQVIVVRHGPADFQALSTVCPHAARLVCPCHGSEFDYAGRRLDGPAPTGLQVLATSYDAASRRVRIQRPPT